MKVFISSLISGFGSQREAARRAVTTLRHEPVMAEDFGAQPNSPQVACLQGLRGSDLVVLVLGERYGFVPAGSSLSATHQEYREARGTKPVLAFVQQGVTPEPEQAAFIEEVQGWEGGLFRGTFTDAVDLQEGIIRALYDVTLASAVAPVDEAEVVARAIALIPAENRNQVTSTFLDLAVAGGPTQRILRPVELEAASLAEHLQQAAMFGEHRVFDRAKGVNGGMADADLVISQERGTFLRLTEQGALAIHMPLDEPRSPGHMGFDMGMVIIEETVHQRLTTALGFAAAILERIDPTQRLTHLAIGARISGAEHRAWRTRAQNAASPNSIQMSMGGRGERSPITVSVRRAVLRLDRAALIEDLLVPLRRQFPTG